MTYALARRAVHTNTEAVGDLEVTVLRDSLVDFPFEMMTGADIAELRSIQDHRGAGEPPRISINAFLVRSSSFTVLIDTGLGGAERESSGLLPAALESLGVRPGDVTHVLLTHLHADHAGGMVRDGELVFRHAQHLAHHAEYDYWFRADFPDRGEAVLEQYQFTRTLRPVIEMFDWVAEGTLLPGIDLVHLPGHTPGHSGYRVHSGADSVLIWGDIVHQPQFQLQRPEWGVAFDSNPGQAVDTRRRVLEDAAGSGERIAGMHIELPAFGFVGRTAHQGFSLHTGAVDASGVAR